MFRQVSAAASIKDKTVQLQCEQSGFQLMYLVQILEGTDGCLYTPSNFYEDNKGTILKCDHVDIKCHFLNCE